MARQTGESRSRIAFSICTNQFYLHNNGREGPKLVSKVTLMKRNTNFSLKNIPSGKTGLPFHMFRCSQKFFAGTNKKIAFHLLSNRNFWKLLVVFDLRLLIVNEFLSITSLEIGASLASMRSEIKPAAKGKLKLKKKDRKIFLFSCALFKFLEGLTIALDASDPASKYYLKNPTSNQKNQEQRH